VASAMRSCWAATPCVFRKASLNSDWSPLGGIGMFRWAQRAGLVDGGNPAAGHRRREGKQQKRYPFAPEEMRVLLSGRPETEPSRHTVRTAVPWPIWLEAHSDARLNELVGLRVADAREERGILYLDLLDHPGRRLKTLAAVRTPSLWPPALPSTSATSPGTVTCFPGCYRRDRMASALGWPAKHSRATGASSAWTARGSCFIRCGTRSPPSCTTSGCTRSRRPPCSANTVPTVSYGLYSGGLSLDRLRQVVEAISYPGE
jgi:hypothetical protein